MESSGINIVVVVLTFLGEATLSFSSFPPVSKGVMFSSFLKESQLLKKVISPQGTVPFIQTWTSFE